MPYLLKGLRVVRPNQAWAIDITYIPRQRGHLYLTAIIDIYSRYIVGWGLHNTLEAANCVEVLDAAVGRYGAPNIINSDKVSQFTSGQWIDAVAGYDIRASMDGRGRAIDNIFIERFWRTVKYE
ncbi:MAG: DDE-type integrase/transposase/recombinase, partial [Mucinivorans sp.]